MERFPRKLFHFMRARQARPLERHAKQCCRSASPLPAPVAEWRTEGDPGALFFNCQKSIERHGVSEAALFVLIPNRL
jgi:hypothetical protein